MPARIEVLRTARQCEDCGAILPAGSQARVYPRKDGSLAFYCLDGHQGQAKGQGTARGRTRLPATKGAAAPAQAQAPAQAPEARHEQWEAYATAMTNMAVDLPNLLSELIIVLRGMKESLDALLALQMSGGGEQQ
jgi:hypothetical protein